MKRLLEFSNTPLMEEGRVVAEGTITCDTLSEIFHANLSSWSTADYRSQWKSAAIYTLERNLTSCFITDYSEAVSSPARITVFTLIPHADAFPKDSANDTDQGATYYLTSSFLFICEDWKPDTLRRHMLDVEHAFGSPFPIFPFWPDSYEAFYPYLSPAVQGISSWTVSRDQVLSMLKT